MALVSVLMPAFNAESFVSDSINSVLNQTLRDIELLIVDDGSTDRTGAILERWASLDHRIRLLRRPNRGVVRTRNELLQWAESPLIAWCDADDVFHPRKLELQAKFLQSEEQYIACGTWYRKFGTSTDRVRKPARDAHLKALTFFGIPMGFPTSMMRSAPIRDKGVAFDETLSSSEDYDFLTRLAEHGKFRNLRAVLLNYRWHASQESQKNILRQRATHAEIMSRYFRIRFPNETFTAAELAFLLSPNFNDANLTEYAAAVLKFCSNMQAHLPELLEPALDILAYRFFAFNRARPVDAYSRMRRFGILPLRALRVY